MPNRGYLARMAESGEGYSVFFLFLHTRGLIDHPIESPHGALAFPPQEKKPLKKLLTCSVLGAGEQ